MTSAGRPPVAPPRADAGAPAPAAAAATPADVDGGPLARLLHKYDTLAALRRARERGEPVPEKAVFRSLAAAFPGALYELDRLPMEDIDARRAALAAALAGGPEAPWMRPMVTYHALYRAALHIKVRAGRGGRARAGSGAEEAEVLAAAASRHAAVEVGPAFVAAVARGAAPAEPGRAASGGRIGPIVLAEVAARHSVPVGAITALLFPTRRNLAVAAPEDESRER